MSRPGGGPISLWRCLMAAWPGPPELIHPPCESNPPPWWDEGHHDDEPPSAHPRADHRQAWWGGEAARRGEDPRGGLPSPRDHLGRLAPLAQPARGIRADDAKDWPTYARRTPARSGSWPTRPWTSSWRRSSPGETSDPGSPPEGHGGPPGALRGLRA